MEKITLQVQGMSCGHCAASVEGALKNIGVTGKVDLAAKSVTFEYDPSQTTLETIKNAIEDQGYDVA